MADQNRWSGEQAGGSWGRDNGRSYRDFDNDQPRYGADRNREAQQDDYRYSAVGDDRNQYSDYGRFGSQRGGRSGAQSGDYDRYGDQNADRYGIPADYTFGRSRTGEFGQSGRSGGDYASNRYGQSPSGQGYGGRGYGQNAGERDFGVSRYQFDQSGRPIDQRSWWDQTRDQVSAWFGDDEAARRRQADDSSPGEHRGRGPKGYTRSDERVREDVSDRLTDHAHLDASEIEVAVSNGEVTLAGTVQYRQDKRHAEDIAEQVSGVKHVQNNLRVKETSGSTKSAGASGLTGASTGSTSNQAGSNVQSKAN